MKNDELTVSNLHMEFNSAYDVIQFSEIRDPSGADIY